MKNKRVIDLATKNTMLRLSETLYIPGLTINLINTTRL